MALTELGLREDVEACMDDCFEAAQAAERCADACIATGGPAMERCIQLCRDVADLATLHARMMARGSEHRAEMAAITAEACQTCAGECGDFEVEHCQVAADALRRCAESCRGMSTTGWMGPGPGQAAH
jgi:hypothetical protein